MEKETEKYDFKLIKRIRVRIHDVPGAFGRVAVELGRYGAMLGDIRKVYLTSQHITRDLIMYFDNQKQFEETKVALDKIKRCKILSIEDEVLNIHRGGKIEVTPTVKVDSLSKLRMIYTPGVAQVCDYILKNPEKVQDFTSIGNSVCIATNGSAILGLGNIGVHAGMPVMEGKSVILHEMAAVSCIPILVDSDDANRIVDTLEAISKTFSMIMIEDIKAPLCFEVEEMLQERLPIPVFHDDQHGTATVILAVLIIALHMLSREKNKVSIVINGAGAAGLATCRMLIEYGFKNIVICDSAGAIHEKRKERMNAYKEGIAKVTNKNMEKGSLETIIKNKDVFIGVSASNLVSKSMVSSMNKDPIVLALANPIPEIMPQDARDAGAAFAKDGRTVNNCLVFPGLVRGTLDARVSKITYPMKFAAAEAIAGLARKHEGVPNFMNISIHKKVAEKVKQAALKLNR